MTLVTKTNAPDDFVKAAQRGADLAFLQQDTPMRDEAHDFFADHFQQDFLVRANVKLSSLRTDIMECIAPVVGAHAMEGQFAQNWLAHMEEAVQLFAQVTGEDIVGFCLTSKRGCLRFHKDKVPYRLLITYHGPGTDWIPNEAADMKAYEAGGKNDDILIHSDQLKSMAPWDMALFKGGDEGILHRSPVLKDDEFSLLLRLDTSDFWRLVERINKAA